jgi:hypothetical protein
MSTLYAISPMPCVMSSRSFILYSHSSQHTEASGTLFFTLSNPPSRKNMSGNTVNPSQLSKMTSPTDNNQMFDPSQVDATDLENFNMMDLDNLHTDFMNDINAGNDFTNTFLDGSDVPVPTFAPVDFTSEPQEVVPMQQPFFPSPATLTPTQHLPAPPPGLAYHPQVGWYYPVAAPSQLPPPGQFGMPPLPAFAPLPAPMYPQAPVPQAPQINAAPVAKTVEIPEAKAASRGQKRKYGPSVYLEEQSKRRANGDDSAPRPVSRDCDYGKHALAAPEQQPRALSGAAGAAGAMKDMKTATLQRCRCDVGKAHIPRPRNPFIIFRVMFSSRRPVSKGKKRGNANPDISKEAGDAWADLGEEGRKKYRDQAKIEAAEHKRLYPNYHYNPKEKIQAKFGYPDCTCGAYQVNMREFLRLKDGGATPPNNFTGIESENGDYAAPRTRSVSRANSYTAPTAQMMPNNDFDFSFESPNGEWAAPQDFNNAAEEGVAEEPPAKKRRSSRNTKKSVHYADNEEGEGTAATPARKHRPSPISTSRKSSNSSQLSSLNSADFKLTGNSVSSRTRSKSTSEHETELPTGLSSPSSLFDDDGEDIDVATPETAKPKATPKAVALALPPRATRSSKK